MEERTISLTTIKYAFLCILLSVCFRNLYSTLLCRANVVAFSISCMCVHVFTSPPEVRARMCCPLHIPVFLSTSKPAGRPCIFSVCKSAGYLHFPPTPSYSALVPLFCFGGWGVLCPPTFNVTVFFYFIYRHWSLVHNKQSLAL